MNFISFLQTAPSGGAGSASSTAGLLGTIIPFALIILVFYFFLIRPQNKKQKETEKMIAALKKGDKIVTIGGIHGVVSSTKEKTIIVKVDDNTKIEFSRTAIAGVEPEKSEKTEKIEKSGDSDDKAEKAKDKNKKEKNDSEEAEETAPESK